MTADIRMHPDYLAMVKAESPHALVELLKEMGIEAGRPVREPIGFDLSPRPRQ